MGIQKWVTTGGTGKVVGIGQQHGVAVCAYTLGRCIVPYLFNLCKLIDKFQNLLFYCFDKYWNEYEYLAYIGIDQLIRIMFE